MRGRRGYEVEADVFGARRVLEDGEDCGHGSSDVGGIESHRYVDCIGGAEVVGGWAGW